MSTKRNVRLRREYLYRKQLESNERVQYEKKRKLKQVRPRAPRPPATPAAASPCAHPNQQRRRSSIRRDARVTHRRNACGA